MCKLFGKVFSIILFCFIANLSCANISIPFELINGLIIVEAEINGTTGSYIIDSGSNGILLNGNSKVSNISYQTLTSTLEGSETKIESFKVGDFETGELLGFSTDLSNVEVFLNKPIAGILGCSIFTPNSLVFDFANSQMIISDSNSNMFDIADFVSMSYHIVEELPMVDIKIDDEVYTFILDSGASSHFIDGSILENLGNSISKTGIEKSIVTAGGEDQIAAEYNIPNCIFGENISSIKAYEKDFGLISKTLEINVSGLLSLSNLSSSIVHFDLKAKKFYFEPF